MDMTIGKNNRIDRLNQQLKITGENLIDYSDYSNNEFQVIREQVITHNKFFLKKSVKIFLINNTIK